MIELLKDNLIKPVAVLPYLLVLSLLCCGIINFALGVTSEEQSKNVEVYGCGQLYDIHCDVLPNSFESVAVSGIIHQVYEVRTDPVAFSNGPHGKALVIPNYQEGPDQDYIPKNTLLNPPKFSVSFWIKPYPGYRFIGQVLSHVNSANTAGWFFITQINQTGSNRDELLKFIVTNDNGTIFSPPEVKIKPNNFIHIVGTFDGNFVKLYADGVLYGSERYEGKYDPDPRTSTAIGVNSFNYKKTWSGFMDDLRIYNRVLDSDDVKEIFDNSTSANVDGLVGHWPFNGNLDDVSGNENNAVVTGPVVSMAFTPDGRLFFSERTTGKVRIMENDTVLEKPFVTIPVHVGAEQGLLGLTIDPHFEQNHFIYIFYTVPDNKTTFPYDRLVRFRESGNIATDEKILIDKIPASWDGRHSGGALAFGTDEKLYVTTGFANEYQAPQNKTSMLGKVLRINRDGTIPADNPFRGSPVYTLGHRNMFGIAFDNKGNGIVTENGDAVYDEINLLSLGANYGFPTFQPENLPPYLANSSSIKPIRYYWNTIGLAQMIFYTGDRFPLLMNKFLYAAYNTKELYALRLNENLQADKEWILIFNDTASVVGPTIAVAMAPNGDLYFGGYRIFKLQSLNSQEPTQILYLIRAELSEGVNIKDMQLYPKDKSMVIKVHNDNASNSFLNLKIPKELIQGISKVTIPNTNDKQLDYTIKVTPRACGNCTGFTLLNIQGLPPSDSRIVIDGTHVISRK